MAIEMELVQPKKMRKRVKEENVGMRKKKR
jgi:hypothetical protein